MKQGKWNRSPLGKVEKGEETPGLAMGKSGDRSSGNAGFIKK
jgi:hypothetical protein